jgi:hypothetical protein
MDHQQMAGDRTMRTFRVPQITARRQETQTNGPMRTLSSLITNFECGNSAHLCPYAIYAVMVLDMYMESSVNAGNTTPP